MVTKCRHLQRRYTTEDKMQAVAAFACYGTIAQAADSLNIPVPTMQCWKGSEWWDKAFRIENTKAQEKLDAGYTRIIAKHIEKIETRIEDGDYAGRDKEGEILLKPVSAKDLAVIGGVLFDKRQLLRGLATNHTSKVDSEGLKKLQAQFEQLAGNKVIVIEK